MDNIGWITISRSIRSHWLWQNPRHLQWWLDLLMEAEWEDKQRHILGTIPMLQRGQLAASVRYLQQRWQYVGDDGKRHTPTERTVLKFLRMLENEKMVILDNTKLPKRTTLIKIVNYDKYQAIPFIQCTPPDNDADNGHDNDADNGGDNEIEIIEINKLNNIRKITREKNLKFLRQYFDAGNSATLEQTLMALRREITNTITMQDFKNLAWEVVSDWIQNLEPVAKSYNEFSNSLISLVRYKNRASKQNGNSTKQSNEQRDAEFAQFVANELASPDVRSDLQGL